MRDYWTCSSWFIKFEKMMGVEKPHAASLEEWESINNNIKTNHKIVWYVTNIVDYLDDFCSIPSRIYYKIRAYIDNGFVTKTHLLQTGLKFGQYHEIEDRMFHGIFNTLVDFVEREAAWANLEKKPRGIFCLKPFRDPESGVDWFDWQGSAFLGEITDATDPEVIANFNKRKEVFEKLKQLYIWYKNFDEKKLKEELWDEYGFNDIDFYWLKEEEIENLKTENMCELIRLRNILWT